MKLSFLLVIILAMVCAACKKEKPIVISGRLLLTQKFPVPLRNRSIEIYQPGSPSAIGIALGSTAARSVTRTDENGYFRVSFTPGKSYFIIFAGTNSQPFTLANAQGDTTFPGFLWINFPDSGYDATKPVFIGKTIDTVVVKVGLSSNLAATDTIGLGANTIGGSIDNTYTGRTGNTGNVLVLDTIYNLLLTGYDGRVKKFNNTVYAGRKLTTGSGYVSIASYGVVLPSQFSATDETKQEVMFLFSK